MDIHRCRFVDFTPSAINALAFSHPSGSAPKHQQVRLAIGRSNGDIEIWNPLGGIWQHESTFYGGKERSIEGLAWVQDPDEQDDDGRTVPGALRLFSIGSSSAVTEWDIVSGLPVRQSSGSHSEVWCIAAQPRPSPILSKSHHEFAAALPQHQKIAVGCADGSVVLLSTADNDLTFERYVARTSEKRARALCIAWRSRNILAVGSADSTVRIFNTGDTRRDTLLRAISLGNGRRGGRKEKLVWALSFLPDGTLVSGDSTGEISWWDRENYSQLQRIQAHEADVLCLTTSLDGETIISGGIDQRTVTYSLNNNAASTHKRWAKIAPRRLHTQDVKTMVSYEDSQLSVVVSGGPDGHPTIAPFKRLQHENHRRISSTPQKPSVVGARRLLLNWTGVQLTIWRVRSRTLDEMTAGDTALATGYDVIARMAIKGDENITTAVLSADARFLAVATMAEVKLFALKGRRGKENALKISKMPLPVKLAQSGGRLVSFSPDSKWLLVVSQSNKVTVAELDQLQREEENQGAQRLLRRGSKQDGVSTDAWRAYSSRITCADFSQDSSILAMSDLAGHVEIWKLDHPTNLEDSPELMHKPTLTESGDLSGDDPDESASGREASNSVTLSTKARWRPVASNKSLPRLPSAPLLLSFCPFDSSTPDDKAHSNGVIVDSDSTQPSATRDSLVVLTAKHELFEFSALQGRITTWSRRNPTSSLPLDFQAQLDRAIGCVWDCHSEGNARRKRLWLYASTWLGMLDLLHDLPLKQSINHEEKSRAPAISSDKQSRKRKRDLDYQEAIRQRRHTAGAGSRKTNIEQQTNVHQVDKKGLSRRSVNGPSNTTADSDYGDDVENEEASSALLRQRRESHMDANGTSEEEGNEDDNAHHLTANDDHHLTAIDGQSTLRSEARRNGPQRVKKMRDPQSFYLTTKYRPILGIVALSKSGGGEDGDTKTMTRTTPHSSGNVLEIALVEKPESDRDFPVRYAGTR